MVVGEYILESLMSLMILKSLNVVILKEFTRIFTKEYSDFTKYRSSILSGD